MTPQVPLPVISTGNQEGREVVKDTHLAECTKGSHSVSSSEQLQDTQHPKGPVLSKAGLKPKQILPGWTKIGLFGAADNSR